MPDLGCDLHGIATFRAGRLHRFGPEQPFQRRQPFRRGADQFHPGGVGRRAFHRFFDQARTRRREVDLALRATFQHRADGDGGQAFPGAQAVEPVLAGLL